MDAYRSLSRIGFAACCTILVIASQGCAPPLSTCDADLNADGFVGGPDFDVFLQCFDKPTGTSGPPFDPSCEKSDLNHDGFVGGPDFDLFLTAFDSPTGVCPDIAARASLDASIAYLSRVMDLYHATIPVYWDVSSAGNRFHAYGEIGDSIPGPVQIDGSHTDDPFEGATSIRCEFTGAGGANWGGFYFLNGVLPPGSLAPEPNWGTVPDAGVDLSGATGLTFWARGETGNEIIDFFMGGVGRDANTGTPIAPFPGSAPVRKITVRLTSVWTQYTIGLAGVDLSYVLGGFGWTATSPVVFYIDRIEYQLDADARRDRLEQPRFLGSFTTEPIQSAPPPINDFDLALRNTAFSYDNALALLAYLARGKPDDVRRARLIGDAFVYAAAHDRFFEDGRLRDAYTPGDLALPPGWTPNGLVGTVPVSGFWDEPTQRFIEINQENQSVGNQAWVLLALVALHEESGDASYLSAAVRIGTFIREFRASTGTYRGFTGGLKDPETATPSVFPWASTEHNLDIYAGFLKLAALTGEDDWSIDAAHARAFVEAMWDPSIGCILTGTADSETRNTSPGQLPSDAQTWSVLSLQDIHVQRPDLLDCVQVNHAVVDGGLTGVDFNEDRDGIWFEGTGHAAAAFALAGRMAESDVFRAALLSAQTPGNHGDGEAIYATSQDGEAIYATSQDWLTTGFDFFFFRRFHIATASWNVFAQARYNPFHNERF